MSGFCETHGRKYVGMFCPWCADPEAKRATANAVPVVANGVVANKSESRHGKYRDVEKRRAYMRSYMRGRKRRPTA